MKIYKDKLGKFFYVFEFDFDYLTLDKCRIIKKNLGSDKFNYYKDNWRFNDLAVFDELQKSFNKLTVDVSMYDDIKKYRIKKEEERDKIEKANEIKNATESTLENIEGIKGELFPYQKLGVEFFVNNNGKGILADSMGLGKTLQALAYVSHTKKKKTLVICPASVKYSWKAEVEKWTKLKPFVVVSKEYNDFDDKVFNDHDIFIINYDLVVKFLSKLKAFRLDCMVADEFHYIKNNAAKRTKAVKEISLEIDSILLLSGKPMLNKPVELFNGLQLIDRENWNNWFKYVSRYCGAYRDRFGLNTNGATHIDELKEKISHYFLRRKKENVLKELPPKIHTNLPVELDTEVYKRYKFAEKEFIKYLREIKNKKISEKQSEQALKLVKLNELRQLSSEGKVNHAKDLINKVIENNEKILVFSVYNQPLEDLKKEFGDAAVMITGKTNAEDRKDIVDEFQSNKNIKIFLGGMKSAGIGITLTAASSVLFVDYSWVPADHCQAEDRAHRIGQDANKVSVYQLYGKDTIDEYMFETLSKKQAIFNKLIEDEPTETKRQTNLITDVINMIEKRST